MPSVRLMRRSTSSLKYRLNFSGTSLSLIASGARPRFGLKPRMSESDAALTCCGLAFSAMAAALAVAFLVVFAGNGVLVLLVTVFAMARTSSREKAMGFDAALRFRMLSRRAFFLDGFSMVGEALT